jgi:uncharacterized membrane protein
MSLWNALAEYRLDFERPMYLWILLILPLLWWLSFRSLAGLGKSRRLMALSLRTMILLLFVAALAEIQLVRLNESLTVIYLLDQSRSIPASQRQAMVDYVNKAIVKHRHEEDKAGVVVFGREAAIEVPPFDDDVQIAQQVESPLDPDYTNLSAAMKLAQASFPEDGARRIVIVSDGNENLEQGEALALARDMTEKGIGIDVVPVRLAARGEVILDKLAMPSDVRKGQTFDLTAVLNNTTVATESDPGTVEGKLIITQKTSDQPRVIAEQDIVLPPGKKAFTIRQEIDQPAFYQYEARFEPKNAIDDVTPENNRATTFTHVRGSGQVLLIEDFEHPGEHTALVEALLSDNLEVTVRPSNQVPTTLAELQVFDTVILSNVPRSPDNEQQETISDAQIKMLVANCELMGGGLVLMGGPNSFGAGGWTNTDLEKAMPVDFTIKSAKVMPKGALCILFHASELANGNYWQKVVARESIKALGNEDYCGVLHYGNFTGGSEWLWGRPKGMVPIKGNREKMLSLLDRMTPGDMPDFDPSLKQAATAFASLKDAAVKHMIIISDGDPSAPSNAALRSLKSLNVTISTVAVGTHGPANSSLLRNIANFTGGKYYEVVDSRALPRIFQREARRVARPLIYDKEPFAPFIKYPHEMVSGMPDPLPPMRGYVMTSLKQNPLVEVAVATTVPSGEENGTILASWTYGLGRAVAFTTDDGARWTKDWVGTENFSKLMSQIVRWSMRPVGDTGKFTISTDVKDGVGTVTITALDQEDAFLNFLDMKGTVLGPNMESIPISIDQTHAGRYIGTFDAKAAGSYFVLVSPAAGQAPIRTGVNVSYSAEFRDVVANEDLLTTMANLEPKSAPAGKVIADPAGEVPSAANLDKLLAVNSFRHDLPKGFSSQDAWHFVILVGSVLFFSDVFVRRVAVNLTWVGPSLVRFKNRLLGRDNVVQPVEYMQRLRSRKAEVSQQIEDRRAAARFEPTPDQQVDVSVLSEPAVSAGPSERRDVPKSGLTPEQEQETYTDRLLKAKKRVWDDRN